MAIDQEYQTNLEILLEKIRVNTSEIDLNTDNLSLNVSVDGLETLQGSTNDLLTTIDADTGAMVLDLAAIEVLLGAANTDHAANEALLTLIEATLETIKVDTEAIETATEAAEVLLGTIDADTNDIKTSVQLLDNAVDGNYLNVNANIAGTDFVGGAGAVASGVQRTTLASNDPAVAKLGEIDTAIDTIDGVLDNSLTKLTEIDTAIDTIDGVLDSSLTKLGEIETTNNANQVLLGTIDADTNAIRTDIAALEILSTAANVDLAAIEVDLAALEVLSTAANVDHAANEVLLGKIRDNQLLMLGNSGSVTISGNAAQSESAGTYCAVYFTRDTTPTTLTIASSTTVADVEYPAGTWLYGDITAITGDSSGLYTLYKGNPS